MPTKTISTGRRPGRPTQRILTVEAIVEKTLGIAGQEGFAAVTMNRLAREMGVTPRALYNHVSSRQEVIDRVWQRLIDDIFLPELEVNNWQESCHTLWNSLRQQFEKNPRVLLIALEEDGLPDGSTPLRIAVGDSALEFFISIGLNNELAEIVREQLFADLFSFALDVDRHYSTGSTTELFTCIVDARISYIESLLISV